VPSPSLSGGGSGSRAGGPASGEEDDAGDDGLGVDAGVRATRGGGAGEHAESSSTPSTPMHLLAIENDTLS
jgi:hypothetical protein